MKEMTSFLYPRWMNSLLGEGYKKELELEDLFEPRKTDESDYLGSKLEKYCFISNYLPPFSYINVFLYQTLGYGAP